MDLLVPVNAGTEFNRKMRNFPHHSYKIQATAILHCHKKTALVKSG